jgi:copper chaperone CopZ
MSCRNCAVRVENALNKLGNVWAKVNLEKKEATVLLKENVDDEKLSAAVGAAGYSAGRIAHIRP